MTMTARATWIDGMAFMGEAGSGHSVVMDGAPEAGGRNIGLRPMEMLLVGLAGCTAFDVVLILKRGREPITDCVVDVSGDRAETDPKVFTRVVLTYRITGEGVDPAKAERAIRLSKEKYCSASVMFGKTAAMTYAWSLNGVDRGEIA